MDVPDVENSKCTGESISNGEQCKILDSIEHNCQLKDETEILLQDGIEAERQIKWEVPMRTLSIESSETPDNVTNRPKTPDNVTNRPRTPDNVSKRSRTPDDHAQLNAEKGGLPLLFIPHS